MCGLFTAMTSWREAVTFANFLSSDSQPKPAPDGGNDQQVTYRVMGMLPLIIFDKEQGRRRVVPMGVSPSKGLAQAAAHPCQVRDH